MENENSDILSKIGKDTGFKIPENYFEDFQARLEQKLPPLQFQSEKKPSLWVKVRPYVYLAAMFAGVWCMMKVFSDLNQRISTTQSQVQTIAEGFQDDAIVEEFIMSGDVSEFDILTYEDSVAADMQLED